MVSNKNSVLMKNTNNLFNKSKIVLKILILTPITILNRLIDIFGVGDSYIFFVKAKN